MQDGYWICLRIIYTVVNKVASALMKKAMENLIENIGLFSISMAKSSKKKKKKYIHRA
jgi:hypothetical protein